MACDLMVERHVQVVGSVRIVIVDRATGAVTRTEAPRMDAVRGVLDALPDK